MACAVLMLVVVAAFTEPSAAAPAITAAGDAEPSSPFTPPDRTLRDLGVSTRLSDGRRLWVFGDTFEPGAARHSAVHSNTAALSEPGAPGALEEALDANLHRRPVVPLSAPEASFNEGQRFRAVSPLRIHDTRDRPGSALGPGQSLDIAFPVPGDVAGPRSVVFNLTAVNTTSSFTDIEVSEPSAPAAPSTSSLNLTSHETGANLVVAPLGPPAGNVRAAPDTVRLRNSAGSVEVIVDLVGYLTTNDSDQPFTAIGPARVYDTSECGPRRNLGAGEQVTVTVRGGTCMGTDVVPAGATAVVVNLTADGPGSSASTHLTAWEDGSAMPPTSNLNVRARDTRANLAVVALSPSGELTLRNTAGSFRVVVDVVGYLTTAPGANEQLVPVAPVRLCDSRDSKSECAGAWSAREMRSIRLSPLEVPTGATAVALNLTIVGPTAPTHLTVWGDGSMPVASNLNASEGAVRAVAAIAPVGPDSTIKVFNNAGSAHVVVDLVGFIAPRAPMVSSCNNTDARPRMAIWPTSIVGVPGAVAPATDRVAIYYVRWVVCDTWTYVAQDVGVALADYTYGQPPSRPITAERKTLQVSVDGSVPPGAYVQGGVARDGFLYLYDCRGTGPTNECFLRRVAVAADLADPASYSYFAGGRSGQSWSPVASGASPVPFDPEGPIPSTQFPAADLSVVWIDSIGGTGSFVMMYEPRWNSGNGPVIVRTAQQPWGPWSEPVTKVGGAQPAVPGCSVTLCRSFHIDSDASSVSHLWFSFYVTGAGRLEHSRLPLL